MLQLNHTVVRLLLLSQFSRSPALTISSHCHSINIYKLVAWHLFKILVNKFSRYP